MRLKFERGDPVSTSDAMGLAPSLANRFPDVKLCALGEALLIDLAPETGGEWQVFKSDAELRAHVALASRAAGCPVGHARIRFCILMARALWAEAEALEIARAVQSGPTGRALASRL